MSAIGWLLTAVVMAALLVPLGYLDWRRRGRQSHQYWRKQPNDGRINPKASMDPRNVPNAWGQ